LLILLDLILLIAVQKVKQSEAAESSVLYALLLLFTGLLLTLGCELFFMKDIFGNRLNTLFRFYYQSWVLLAIASAFGLYYLHRHWQVSSITGRVVKASWWAFLVLLIIASFLYTITGTWSRANGFSASPTLDGLAFLERSNPSEAEAIEWLNNNVKDAPVIAEAAGSDYSMYGRVSGWTGLSTILGWEQHEWVWRGSDRDTIGKREQVNLIYESDDFTQIKAILDKYKVTFVYVGDLEREHYGPDVGKGFKSFMDVAFENEGVTIYKVRE
jgi:YYY domain-containing protein